MKENNRDSDENKKIMKKCKHKKRERVLTRLKGLIMFKEMSSY